MLSGAMLSIPARPAGDYTTTCVLPPWIAPVTRQIADGDDRSGPSDVPNRISQSGIGFTTDGDLLFYRKLSSRDWEEHPMLNGIAEVWVAFEMHLSD